MIRLELTAETPEALAELVHQLDAQFNTRFRKPGPTSAQSRKRIGNANRKRTDEEVLHILKRANEIGVYAAAVEAGVNPAWLSRIRNGHIWRHLGVA